MRSTILILLLSVFAFAFANPKLKPVDLSAEQIPSSIKYKGAFVAAVKYKDSLGVNYIIQTETALLTPKSAVEAANKYELVVVNGKVDTIRNIEADYRIKGLFVYHYVESKDSIHLIWKHLDNIKECSYKNIKGNYLSKPIITDLDNNNKAEIWLLYQMGCRENDKISLNMKLVMYEGMKSYTVRGIRLTKYQTEADLDANMVKADPGFNELPKITVDYSKQLWQQYMKEQ